MPLTGQATTTWEPAAAGQSQGQPSCLHAKRGPDDRPAGPCLSTSPGASSWSQLRDSLSSDVPPVTVASWQQTLLDTTGA